MKLVPHVAALAMLAGGGVQTGLTGQPLGIHLVGAERLSMATWESGLRVQVTILDYAGVPPEVFRLAKARASMIFGGAGLTIEWQEIPNATLGQKSPDPQAVAPAAHITLLPDSMADRFRRSPGELGFAMGFYVYVFPDRILNATRASNNSFPIVLGHIMAHELGHVFVGKDSHAAGTVMAPELGPREFGLMEMGLLRFLPAHAARMKKRLFSQRTAGMPAAVAR